MTLSYWVLAAPERVGLITAFLLGFAADLATGSPLGEHGLVYLVLVLFFSATYHQVRVLPIWQQAIIVAFAMLIGLILQYLFLSLTSGSLASVMIFEGFRKCANVALGIFAVTNDQAPSPLNLP